ncbi:MAG: hypothetical protein WCG87_11855 [Bacteroidota bacterium]
MNIENIALELIQQYYAQLQDLNYAISQRPEGERHPSTKEAVIMCKLLSCIKALRKEIAFCEEVAPTSTDMVMPKAVTTANAVSTATIHTGGVSTFAIPSAKAKQSRITKVVRKQPRTAVSKSRRGKL